MINKFIKIKQINPIKSEGKVITRYMVRINEELTKNHIEITLTTAELDYDRI